jgi:5-methylcytosine-specific restriction endonuclease McrA
MNVKGCKHCHATFFSKRANHLFCSRGCSVTYNNQKRSNSHRYVETTCEVCCAKFPSSDGRSKYCLACRNLAMSKKRRDFVALFTCQTCHIEFESKSPVSKFCNQKCFLAAHAHQRAAIQIQYRGYGKANPEIIKSVYEQYNWECVYCGYKHKDKAVRKTLSIDHLTPLSRGGANDADNIVVACNGLNGCNSIKNDKTLIEFLFWREAEATC